MLDGQKDEILPNPVINLAIVKDIYSGIKAPNIKPTAIINCERINAIFLPSLSEINPIIYDIFQ